MSCNPKKNVKPELIFRSTEGNINSQYNPQYLTFLNGVVLFYWGLRSRVIASFERASLDQLKEIIPIIYIF